MDVKSLLCQKQNFATKSTLKFLILWMLWYGVLVWQELATYWNCSLPLWGRCAHPEASPLVLRPAPESINAVYLNPYEYRPVHAFSRHSTLMSILHTPSWGCAADALRWLFGMLSLKSRATFTWMGNSTILFWSSSHLHITFQFTEICAQLQNFHILCFYGACN